MLFKGSCSRRSPPWPDCGAWSGRSDRYLDLEMHPTAEPGLGHLPEQVMWRDP